MRQKVRSFLLPILVLLFGFFLSFTKGVSFWMLFLYRFLLTLSAAKSLFAAPVGAFSGAILGARLESCLLVPILASFDAIYCILFYYVRKLSNYAAATTATFGACLFVFLGVFILEHIGWTTYQSVLFYWREGTATLLGGMAGAFILNRRKCGV